MNRTCSLIAGGLIAGCVAMGASARAHGQTKPMFGSPGIVPVGFIEKNIGPESLPSSSPTSTSTPGATASATPQANASPSSSPTPSSASGDVWQQVPTETSPENTEAPVATATAQVEMPGAGLTTIPSATMASLAPVGIGAVTPTPQISNSSLKRLIAQASTPALAASLHFTDQARKQIMANQPDKALHFLGNALSIDPSNPYAYLYLGRAWLEKNNYAQAITFFRHAQVDFNSMPRWLGETLAFEGLTYEQSGQAAEAMQIYVQALQANPGNLMARVGYTRLAMSGITPAGPVSPAPGAGSETAPPPTESPAPPPPASEPPAPAN